MLKVFTARGYTFWRNAGADRWYAVTKESEQAPKGGSYRSLKYLLKIKGLSREEIAAGLAADLAA